MSNDSRRDKIIEELNMLVGLSVPEAFISRVAKYILKRDAKNGMDLHKAFPRNDLVKAARKTLKNLGY